MIEKKSNIFERKEHAFKGFASTQNVEISSSFHPELQIKDTILNLQLKINKKIFSKFKRFKFVTTLVLVFKNIESEDKAKFGNFYSSSKGEKTINDSDIDDVFKSIYTTTISNIHKSLGKSSG